MGTIKYINNNKLNGVQHDWNKAIELWNKLSQVHMGELYDSKYHFHNVDTMWQVYMSPRDMGKTTNILGVGLALHKMDGLKIGYIRNRMDDIKESIISTLFDGIIQNGYVSDIYGEEYNTIRYFKNKRCFNLCYVNEDGKVEKVDENELLHVHSLDYSPEATKSGYVSPMEDLLIYDEFIAMNGITTENNFLALNHLLSTITRERISCRFYLLANTITAQSHIFHELEIYSDIQQMKIPESRVVHTRTGMPVYVEYISLVNGKQKERRVDRLLSKFGFKNPKLSSITGDTKSEVVLYPHLPRKEEGEERERLDNYIYISMYGRLFRIILECSSIIGWYAYVFETTTEPKEDAIIYTMREPEKVNERYGMGSGDILDKFIYQLYKEHRFKYSYNDVGSALDMYIEETTGRKWR